MEKETGLRAKKREGAERKGSSRGDSNSNNSDASANTIVTGNGVVGSAVFIVGRQEGEVDDSLLNKVVGREIGEGLQGAAEEQDIVIDSISNSNNTKTVVDTGKDGVDAEIKIMEGQRRSIEDVVKMVAEKVIVEAVTEKIVVEAVAEKVVVDSGFADEAFQTLEGSFVKCVET